MKRCSRFLEGETPLHSAALKGNLVAADLFIQFGVDLNSTTKRGDTPLLFAAANGHIQMTRFLISMGANPDSIATSSHLPEVIQPILKQAKGRPRSVVETLDNEILNVTIFQAEHLFADSLLFSIRYGSEERRGERRGVREQMVEWNQHVEFSYRPDLPSLLIYLFRPTNLGVPFAMTAIRIENGISCILLLSIVKDTVQVTR
jgi:hypothetical protein